MANAKLAELPWYDYSRISYHRFDLHPYDPSEALKCAVTVGILDEGFLNLPVHLINSMYPYFERYGVAALVEDYANIYSAKAASINLVQSERRQLFYCYFLANSFGIPDLVAESQKHSFGVRHQEVNDVPGLISHIIHLWTYYETKPFLCPGGGMVFATRTKNPTEGLTARTILSKDFAELVHSLPDSLLAALPSHIQVYASLQPAAKSILIQSPAEKCARSRLFARFGGPEKPVRVR